MPGVGERLAFLSQACDDQEEHAIFLATKIPAWKHGRLWAASSRWRTKKVAWARPPQPLTSLRVLAPRRSARCWSISIHRATARVVSVLIVNNVPRASMMRSSKPHLQDR